MTFDSLEAPAACRLPLPCASDETPPPSVHQPRPLTPGEQRKLDWFVYHSPKLGRRIELVGCIAFALGLSFEFNPDMPVFIERPRLLPDCHGGTELSFFTQEANGRERYWLLVPEAETEPESPGSRRRVHRRARTLIESAQGFGLALEFVFEQDLLLQADSLAAAFRMLPYVQAARRLPHREALADRVRDLMQIQNSATFRQIEAHLSSSLVGDVRAVVCDLIHAGELQVELMPSLSGASVVRRREVRHD